MYWIPQFLCPIASPVCHLSPDFSHSFPALSCHSYLSPLTIYLKIALGAPGWRSRLSIRLQPGHDLAVREFEPRIRLWADGSEPGACFRFCVSLSLCPSPVHALSLSVPKINKNVEKKKKESYTQPTEPPRYPKSLLCLEASSGFAKISLCLSLQGFKRHINEKKCF